MFLDLYAKKYIILHSIEKGYLSELHASEQ